MWCKLLWGQLCKKLRTERWSLWSFHLWLWWSTHLSWPLEGRILWWTSLLRNLPSRAWLLRSCRRMQVCTDQYKCSMGVVQYWTTDWVMLMVCIDSWIWKWKGLSERDKNTIVPDHMHSYTHLYSYPLESLPSVHLCIKYPLYTNLSIFSRIFILFRFY